MLRRVVVILVMLMLVLVNVASGASGNFNALNTTLINTFKLIPGPEVGEFKMYKSSGGSVLIGVLPIKNWVAEAFVVCKGDITAQDMIKAVAVIYGFVQETRWFITGQPQEGEIIMDGGYKLWEKRAEELLYTACKQLYHTKESVFTFDNITVKAMDIGDVGWHKHTKDRSYDIKKMVSIKLWIK